MDAMWQHKWALWSGFLGATASSFVKMGVGGDGSSPLLNFVQTGICERPLAKAWLVDLDEVLLSGIHRVLGDLMIKYGINLMPYWKILRTRVLEEVAVRFYLFEIDYCQLSIALPVRIICIVAMLVTNAYMIASFLRGIQESGSVGGTSLSTAANFASSAIYGKILWGEQMNGMWCLGFSCVIVGVVILSSETSEVGETTPLDDKNKAAGGISTYTDVRTRIKNLERSKVQSNSKPAKPPPPLVIRKKTRKWHATSENDGIKGTVTLMRSSFMNKENSSPRPELKATTPTRKSIKKSNPLITSSRDKDYIRIPFKPAKLVSTSPSRRSKKELKPESTLKQYYNFNNKSISLPTNLTNRSFVNECALCDLPLFDKGTGASSDAVADLSVKTCFHLFHSRCIKQTSKSYGNSCPICVKPLAMWTASKQAAEFPGFWLELVENFLRSINGAPKDSASGKDLCLPASTIRAYFKNGDDLTEAQKLYIQDDPTGMGKGLQAALEWGGYTDYNKVPKGHVGFLKALRTRGIWKYDSKKDDLWFWDWGSIHPRQRCDQCQMIKRPLPVKCERCCGSSEAAFYCSELCAKRDKQRHKQTCDAWKANVPKL